MRHESTNIRRLIKANRLLKEQGHDGDALSALNELETLRSIARRSATQLRKWAEWYGNADHAARGQLPPPPAGDIELADDISAALGPNVGALRQGRSRRVLPERANAIRRGLSGAATSSASGAEAKG